MVLKWSTVPDETNNNHRIPTRSPAMKISHDGAKPSTPMELLYAFDPQYIVVSNGVKADWNHPTLNYPPYLTYDANGEDLAVDPGYIVSIWDKGFQAEILKIYPDNNSFIREVANTTPMTRRNWRFVSSFEAHRYAGNFVSWGTFFDEWANQELRAVIITQTAQGGGDETVEDTRPTRAGASSSPSLRLSVQPSLPSDSTPEVSSFAEVEAGEGYCFLAPKDFKNPPIDQAVEVTDVGLSNLLGWLRLCQRWS
ncbi:uncharacterized protein FTOL_13396 [Fusarium torulosum]|uniref:Uncharacterized protein n=1 Tax=Fusarium torulosum TaxID=33205 RepID=A0AAE8SPS8_9HYPO|nr:uncharacterized protein FTOL_13396 [Fusarium torulosum]